MLLYFKVTFLLSTALSLVTSMNVEQHIVKSTIHCAKSMYSLCPFRMSLRHKNIPNARAVIMNKLETNT